VTHSAPRPEPYAYRRDAAVPAFDDASPIVIFDGKCVMCAGFVQFLLRHDHRARLRFLTAQSMLGEALYRHFGLAHGAFDTYVLLDEGRARVKSDAALRIFALLGLPYSLLATARVAPRGFRDWIYDIVARNRVRWFGAREVCYAPTAADAARFVR
jgi:predicted DCC family thiol-disulfide oxidoreductase YuxK